MKTKPHIIAYEELKKLRKPIQNVNVKHKETLGVLEKFAVWITNYVGSMGFFLQAVAKPCFVLSARYRDRIK